MKNVAKIFRLNCDPKRENSHEDHHTRLTEYDDWMRQEEKRYSDLINKLNIPGSLSLYNGSQGCGSYHGQSIENRILDQEETLLTGDEILHECGLTMHDILCECRKRKEAESEMHSDRNSTQHSIVFQCTISVNNSNVAGFMNKADDDFHADMTECVQKDTAPWDSIIIESGKRILYVKIGEESSVSGHANYGRNEGNKEIVDPFHHCKQNSNG